MLFDSLNKLERCLIHQDKKCNPLAIGAGAIIGGAAISAAGQLGGSVLQNYYNRRAMSVQHEYELENMEKEQAWQEKMYKQSLADSDLRSDPAYIRGLLEKAGYNPFLADGSGQQIGAGQLGSSPSASTSVGAPQANFGDLGASAVAQGLRDYISMRNMEADTNLKKANAKDLEAAGVGKEIQNQYAHSQMQLAIQNQIADLLEKASRIDRNSAEYKLTMKNIDMLTQQYEINQQSFDDQVAYFGLRNDAIDADISLKNEQKAGQVISNAIAEIERKYKVKFSEQQLETARMVVKEGQARIDSLAESNKLTQENVKRVAKETAKIAAEKVGIDNNNRAFSTFMRKVESEIYRNYGSSPVGQFWYHQRAGDLPSSASSNGTTSEW